MTDPFVVELLNPSKVMQYGVEAFFTVGVIVAGKLWIRFMKKPSAESCGTDGTKPEV